jgi:hypothetical protein
VHHTSRPAVTIIKGVKKWIGNGGVGGVSGREKHVSPIRTLQLGHQLIVIRVGSDLKPHDCVPIASPENS